MEIKRTLKSILPILGSVTLLLAAWPQTALALQTHGDPEGLHVHQLAHAFFAFSMGLFIYWLRKWGLANCPGWRTIRLGALFLILWNINAIVGHWLEELTQLLTVKRVGSFGLEITTVLGHEWLVWLYYATKLDHLLCVPALFCLMVGLRRLYSLPLQTESENGAV